MSAPKHDPASAYVAAAQALAAMGVRNLAAIESDDPEVWTVVVACTVDGQVMVTVVNKAGDAVGGYEL